MSNKQAPTGNAGGHHNVLPGQINLFLFDLKNEANEHGFRNGDSWHLQIVSDSEINRLKMRYSPVLSIRLNPESLLSAFQLVKTQLQQSLSKSDLELTAGDLEKDDKRNLAAYPDRNVRK